MPRIVPLSSLSVLLVALPAQTSRNCELLSHVTHSGSSGYAGV